MSYFLWLDDLSEDPETPTRHPPDQFLSAKSSQEAIDLVNEKGLPGFISFDHDLGFGDDATVFINWLTDNYLEHEPPDFQVHSANPVGRDNIISKMESWKRYYNSR